MEYEIEEESWLLDASNNPSLDRAHQRPAIGASWRRPAEQIAKPQKAEPIPEATEPA